LPHSGALGHSGVSRGRGGLKRFVDGSPCLARHLSAPVGQPEPFVLIFNLIVEAPQTIEAPPTTG
jgi:hypothetical protein